MDKHKHTMHPIQEEVVGKTGLSIRPNHESSGVVYISSFTRKDVRQDGTACNRLMESLIEWWTDLQIKITHARECKLGSATASVCETIIIASIGADIFLVVGTFHL